LQRENPSAKFPALNKARVKSHAEAVKEVRLGLSKKWGQSKS